MCLFKILIQISVFKILFFKKDWDTGASEAAGDTSNKPTTTETPI
jgi:hypothetical protein